MPKGCANNFAKHIDDSHLEKFQSDTLIEYGSLQQTTSWKKAIVD